MSLDILALLAVLAAAVVGGAVARRVGYPSILGELLAGIVLGPPLLGLLAPDDTIAVIGKLGVVLLMLYIGLHLDPSDLGKAATAGALASFGGFVVPAALGFGLMMWVDGDTVAALFVGVAMGVTSLATKSRILVDLGILNTRVAHVLMAGALFSDVAALIIFSALLGLSATGTIALSTIGLTVLKAAVFLIGSWIVGTRVFPVVGRLMARHTVDTQLTFLLVVLTGLGFAAAADAAGLHAILGAFLAGLFIRDGVLEQGALGEIERRARGLSVGLLAPVFFVTAGFGVSFDVIFDDPFLLFGVVALATIGKILGTALFYLPTGYGFREGIAVGTGMNGRGAVEIIVAELALEAGLIDTNVFSVLVFMAIFTTATVPFLLTRAIQWLRSHNQLVSDDRETIVIVGGGSVTRRVAVLLAVDAPVTIIDTNSDHCVRARQEGLTAINGSGLDEDTLELAGAADARLLIAATGNSETNLLTASVAKRRFGIPQIAVALTAETNDSLFAMLDDLGGELLFGRPTDITSWDAELEAGRIAWFDRVVEDMTEVLDPATATDPDSLPIVIERPGGETTVYTAGQDPRDGDRVHVVGRTLSTADLPALTD